MKATTTATAPTTLEQVAPRCYAWVQPPGGWCLNNAGLVTVPGGGSVLIDTAATERRASVLRAAVRAVVGGDPDYLVSTHFHGDHTFGNHLFERSTLVATTETGRLCDLAGDGLCSIWPEMDWGRVDWGTPDVSFDDKIRIDLGGAYVDVFDVGPAHTPSDLVVWEPEQRVLFTGDVAWNGVTPFILMGSATGSLRALDRLLALEPEVVVPGHGPVGDADILRRTADYVHWLLEIGADAHHRGCSGAEAAEAARRSGVVPDLLDAERLLPNLERTIAEMDGTAPGAPMDVAGSFARMVAFNGGLPVSRA